MEREALAEAWIKTGFELQKLLNNPSESQWKTDFEAASAMAGKANPWFTEDQIQTAFNGIVRILEPDKFNSWISGYSKDSRQPRNIGIIMAGNIPMAGFHDLLCVSLTGHKTLAKQSSSDKFLLPFITKILNSNLDNAGKPAIEFVDQLKDADAIIATGSNNTSRYFDYYFGQKPHIFRKNRNSVAVLDGSENEYDIILLGKDIFTYFGLGCRNVSKLFVPEGYSFDEFFKNLMDYSDIMSNVKYMNNFDYHQALYLLNRQPFLTNNFIIVTESTSLSSPVGVVYFEYYRDEEDLQNKLDNIKNDVQCVVRKNSALPPGKAQFPDVDDYADGVDTMEFLISLN